MKFIFTDNFYERLGEIEDFIAEYNPQRAEEFHNALYDAIYKIDFMPYKHRKNPKLDNEEIRDLIFKGYVISFFIQNDEIIILDIYKNNLPNI